MYPMLRAFILHGHRDAGRQMRHAHRGFSLVHTLTAGAARPKHFDLQIALVDLDINLNTHTLQNKK